MGGLLAPWDVCCVVVRSHFLCCVLIGVPLPLPADPPLCLPLRSPPTAPHPQVFGRAGSLEPLRFQTGEEEGKGQAGPSPASIPRGHGRGEGGTRQPFPLPVQPVVPSPNFLSRGPPGPRAGAEEGPALRTNGAAAGQLQSDVEMGTAQCPGGHL